MSCKHCCNCNHAHHEEYKHEHNHEHHHEEKECKISLVLYIVSVIIFLLTFIPIDIPYKFVMYLVVVILSGYELILKGIKNIFHLNFEEDTLMTIAVIAAFALGEFPESCMVILLFRLGEFIEDKAVENSNKNINDIVKIKPKTANLLDEKEEDKIVKVEDVKIGDKIIIKPGEMVPLDCKIIKGKSSLDTSEITGESIPVYVEENQEILSGSINLTGRLICVVSKDDKNSTASQIVDLVYQATNNKGKTEEFITKFSKIYTPTVIIIAILVAILPPMFLGAEFKTWIMRALVFLVASCPCSIVISVPLAFFSCIGAISKKGMLVKGTKHIEDLSKTKYIAFDKTGTITTGKMKIEKIVSKGNYTEEDLIKYMYCLEKNSNHPISTAIKQIVENKSIKTEYSVENYEEIAGHGITGEINGKKVLFGNKKLLTKNEITEETIENANYLIIDGKLEGYITLEEEIREDAKELVKDLKHINVQKTVMLTGDNGKNAEKIGKQIGIDKVYYSLLPKEKLEKVRELKKDGKVVFVGDGINDSPVLAESDFGISIGEGTEIANNTADGILISNKIGSIPSIIKIAKKSMKIIKFNIAFSLILKAIVLTLGILGYAPVWLAVAADTGVTLLTVLNSMRIFRK